MTTMNLKLNKLIEHIDRSHRQPDFANIVSILNRDVPSRPTVFEFTLNNNIYQQVTGTPVPADGDGDKWAPYLVKAFSKLGYDFAVIGGDAHQAIIIE